MGKFYFISYQTRVDTYSSNGREVLNNEVIDIHPFQWQIENKKTTHSYNSNNFTQYSTLLNFQEISEEDYHKYINEFNNY